ncbi:MAG: FKBP-type peptidyl-prolyl cis-trans isomerase [Erythrobacter sp.]|jgi:FKBP-type peptidyl-prolyl cis-trans isomerase|nr:FKBP-type peptidyl-prolyl cis-trans isomerase [Erythrobacter sp.]
MKHRFFGLLALLAAAPTVAQPAPPADTSQDLAWMSAQQAYPAGLSASDGWYMLEGGLRWRYLDYTANDNRPTVADTVTVHYEGKLIDGTVFDSSYERGEPAQFPLGRLIKAWQLAIPQMGVGDVIELVAPADLAYGPVGKGPIPGGATLIFKVELVGIAGR